MDRGGRVGGDGRGIGRGSRRTHGAGRMPRAQLRRALRAPRDGEGRTNRAPRVGRPPGLRRGAAAAGLRAGSGVPPAPVPPRQAPPPAPARGEARGREIRPGLVGRGARPRRLGDAPRAGEARPRGALRPVRHGLVQPDERLARRPASHERRGGVPRDLEQLLVGRDQRRDADGLRHPHDRQPAPGLAQREADPDVGLEPGRDARRDEQRLVREARKGAGRPRRLHRPEAQPLGGRARRRVGPDPSRHRRRDDDRDGARHRDRGAARRGVREEPLRRLRRIADAARVRRGGELARLPPRHEGRRPEDARMGRADHRGPGGDDRAARQGVRDEGPRRPLPGLRDATTRVRRAGRARRVRPRGPGRKRRHPRWLGFGSRQPGAGRRPLLDRFPDGREPVRRGDSLLPMDGSGPEGPGDGGGGRRRLLRERRPGAGRLGALRRLGDFGIVPPPRAPT